jgi:hypothetical protein
MVAQVSALLASYGFTGLTVSADRIVDATNINTVRSLSIHLDCHHPAHFSVHVAVGPEHFFRNTLIALQGFASVNELQHLLDNNKAFISYHQLT